MSAWQELSKEQQGELYSMKQAMWEKIMEDMAASYARFPDVHLTWMLTLDVSVSRRMPTKEVSK